MTRLALPWAGVGIAIVVGCRTAPPPTPAEPPPPEVVLLDEPAVRAACAGCHGFVPPTELPRVRWGTVIEDMFTIAEQRGHPLRDHAKGPLNAWFVERAPGEVAPPPRFAQAPPPDAVQVDLAPAEAPPTPAIGHMVWADIGEDARPELLACDTRHGLLLVLRGGETTLEVLRQGLGNPVHVEPVDLDGDGGRDLLVADLGALDPGDHAQGRVLLLRRAANGDFEPHELATRLPRPTDARAIDMDGDGDLDVAVAAFGWRTTGRLSWLENPGSSDAPWRETVLRDGSGAVRLAVADLDGDGARDLVAAFGQEREEVVAWLRRGAGHEERALHGYPLPTYGTNGLHAADVDGDGDVDLLVSHGDTLDDHTIKPHHGVTLLRNNGSAAFAPTELGFVAGATDVGAGDLDGDGDVDIVTGALLPQYGPRLRAEWELAGVVWFEQQPDGAFRRRVLQPRRPSHGSVALLAAAPGEPGTGLVAAGVWTALNGAWDRSDAWIELLRAVPPADR